MSNKSFWNSLGDALSFIFFIKYGLPIMLIIIIILFVYQGIYSSNIDKKYENMQNVIVTSKLSSTICDYAIASYDRNVFSDVKGDEHNSDIYGLYSVEINYTFNNVERSAEELDSLVKNEVTKLYDKLKDKKIEKDQIFAQTDRKSVGLTFYISNNYGGTSMLCSASLIYNDDIGFVEESYQNEISKTIVTIKDIEDAKNRNY